MLHTEDLMLIQNYRRWHEFRFRHRFDYYYRRKGYHSYIRFDLYFLDWIRHKSNLKWLRCWHL